MRPFHNKCDCVSLNGLSNFFFIVLIAVCILFSLFCET